MGAAEGPPFPLGFGHSRFRRPVCGLVPTTKAQAPANVRADSELRGSVRERTYWLKGVGSASDPMVEEWVTSAPQELSHVHFSARGKPKVRVGDYLIYCTALRKRIIGVAEVYMPPTNDGPEERWPWRCRVKPHLMLATIEGAPSLDVLNETEEGKLRLGVRQISHLKLNPKQYRRALTALEGAFDASRGDILGDWPMFQTRLSPSRQHMQSGH
jgi:hypothetical protein